MLLSHIIYILLVSLHYAWCAGLDWMIPRTGFDTALVYTINQLLLLYSLLFLYPA